MITARMARLSQSAASKTARAAIVGLLIVMAAVFLVQTFGKAHREIGYDFTSYLASARALAHGENPYATGSAFPYLYPLFLAFALIPLTLVPYWLAVFLWYAISIAALASAACVFAGLTKAEQPASGSDQPLLPLFTLSVLLIPILQNNLLNGQVNFLVLLLCVLFLKFHLENRVFLAPLMLAMGIAIKIVPAILILFLLVRRRFQEAALTFALAVVLCLAPAGLLGAKSANVIAEYFNSMFLGRFTGDHLAAAKGMFFSLAGFLSYLVPDAAEAGWLKPISVGLVVLIVLLTHYRVRSDPRRETQARIFSLYLIAILLVVPMSETHHLAFLLPAVFLTLVMPTRMRRLHPALRWGIPGMFFVLFWLGKSYKLGPFLFLATAYLFLLCGWNILFDRHVKTAHEG